MAQIHSLVDYQDQISMKKLLTIIFATLCSAFIFSSVVAFNSVIENVEVYKEASESLEEELAGRGYRFSTTQANEIVVATSTVNTALYPDVDLGADLGKANLRFNNTFFNNVTISGTCTGCGGDIFAWTPETLGNATSTLLLLKAGLISSASSTFSSSLDVGVITGVDASEVAISLGSGSPTVDQMQEYLDNTGSSGYFTGGILSDAGSGAVAMTAGEGFIRASADDNAPILSFLFAASTSIAIVPDTTRYIFVDDTGTISTSASEFDEAVDNIMIGVATDEGGSISHTFNLGVRLEESIGQLGRYTRRVDDVVRDKRKGGLIFGQSGDANRDVTVSEGSLWWGRTEYPISAFDTSGADTFDTYTANGKEHTATSSWDNINYDNGGTLTTMANNRWAVLWFYIEPDGHIVMIYGRNQYVTEGQAEDELAPASSIPNRISSASVISAKFIFQKSSNTATKIESAFGIPFTSSGVTDHGNLAGLSDDDHTQYLLINGTRSMTGSITPNGNNSLNLGAYGSAWSSIFVSSTSFLNYVSSTQFEGALIGNASTATASADNPDNCSAGSYPLGVDANWDVESCTDATTEIDSAIVTAFPWTPIAQFGANSNSTSTPITIKSNLFVSSTLVVEESLFGFQLVSTSPDMISGGAFRVPKNTWKAREITQFRCSVDSGTSIVVNVTDTGTNDTETITCATTQTTDSAVTNNNTFTADEFWGIEIGTITGAVDYLNFEAIGYLLP